jgi:hypothetical protein
MNAPLANPRPIAPGLAPTPSAASGDTGMDNFLRLFKTELAQPLSRFAELARGFDAMRAAGFQGSTLTGAKEFAEMAEIAQRSAGIADRLTHLGEVLTGAPILGDERILLIDTLRTAVARFADPARQRRLGIQLDDGHQALAPIYGSATWLELALECLLARLAAAAPPGAHLLLRLRQIGFHQLVAVNINHGRPAANAIDLLPPHRAGVKTMLATARQADLLDLALARAIVEQHGGTLKSDEIASGRLTEFHLTLPTGESQALRTRPDCGNCPHLRQAEAFARDIGELLNAPRGTAA